MKLHELLREASLGDEVDDEIVPPPPKKRQYLSSPEQRQKVAIDTASDRIANRIPRRHRRLAEHLRDFLITKYSGAARTSFEPITYENAAGGASNTVIPRIRIKVARDINTHLTDEQQADMAALAEFLHSRVGIKATRDGAGVYLLTTPERLLAWEAADFPTTKAEVEGTSNDRAYDPWAVPPVEQKAPWVPKEPGKVKTPEQPTAPARRRIPAAEVAKRKALERQAARDARKAQAPINNAADETAAIEKAKRMAAQDKADRLRSPRKGWGV